jgi:tetratricopeptide (TPR) repeat protein
VKTSRDCRSKQVNLPCPISASQRPRFAGKYLQNLATRFFLLAALAALAIPVLAKSQSPKAAEASVEGTVRDASGKPVANASVSLVQTSDAQPIETKSNIDGTFAFSPLPVGAFKLKATKADAHTTASKSLELSAGEKKHIDLVLDTQLPATDPAVHSAPAGSSPDSMEFSDQPDFTVAGMTDWSNLGLHGSDATTRTSEALAKETLALKSSAAHDTTASAGGDAGAAHRLSGDREEHSGDPVAAVREYEQAAHLDPSEENYFAWGSELLLHRAAQPAAEVFTKGAALHPKSPRMLAGLGAALYADGLYDEAARRLCQASDLNPADPAPYLFLGKMEETAADAPPCAEEKLARFAQAQLENALANYYYGIAIWKRARRTNDLVALTKTQELFKKAVAHDPAFAAGYLALGNLYFVGGDLESAKLTLKKAIAVDSQLGQAHYLLGQAYQRTGEEEKAQQEFAIYKQCEKREADALERQRRELRQFLVILNDQSQPPQPK